MSHAHHFLADDGEKIHLHIQGQGSPVVFLHGWTSSHQEWFPFAAELSKQHTIYRWDARGHGGHTLRTGNTPTLTRMGQDLANLLEHYDLHDATVIGHSMGALTLWQYLQQYGSQRLARVGFIDQSPRLLTGDGWQHGIYGDFDQTRAAAFSADLRSDFAESVLRLGAYGLNQRAREKYEADATGWKKSREWLRTLPPEPLIGCWESLLEADFRDLLANIDIPALLVYGGQSNFYGLDTAHAVATAIPRATLHIYDNADHSPHQWQRERFVRDVLDFINAA